MRPPLKPLFVLFLLVATSARAQCPTSALPEVSAAVRPADGFPLYYDGADALALEPCLDPNPLGPCAAALIGTLVPKPAAAITFPNNFPTEFPYFNATATMTLPTGGKAVLVHALNGSFLPDPVTKVVKPTAGLQLVFSRLRIRLTSVQPFGTYTITHPYGVSTLVADSVGNVNVTLNDIGAAAPGFFGPVSATGQVGPTFLRWDASLPLAPAGFIGDSLTPHTVTGSPCGTNFFKVEGPLLPAGGVQTPFFVVTGKQIDICGNHIVDAGEQCDDGNKAAGDCCSPTCQAEPAGQACDVTCSIGSTCDGAGACTLGPAAPKALCEDGNPCTSGDVCVGTTCVGGPPPACSTTVITADVSPKAANPTTKFGTAKILAIDSDTAKETFLRFHVTGLGTRPLTSAKVRLTVAGAAGSQSNSGGQIHAISNCTWSEAAMTWNVGRPAIDGPVLSTVGAVALKKPFDFDVTSAMNLGDGDYCFAVDTLSADEADYNSREAASGKPQLILTFADGCACATPVCGDNAVNQPSEQCDGRSDIACPGHCSANCLCPPPTTTTTTSSTSSTSSSSTSTTSSSTVSSSTLSSVPTTTATTSTAVTSTVVTTTVTSTVTSSTVVVAASGTNAYQAGVSGPAGSAAVDTYIRLSAPTTNNGTATDVIVGLTNSATKVNRALMAFDVSDIPANATVHACTLGVNVLQATSATPGHIRRLCGEHWLDGDGQGELQATWNSWKTGSAWTSAGADAAGDCATGLVDYTTAGEVAYSPPTATGAFTFPDLTALCQDAVTLRAGLLRLRITQDAEATQSTLFRFDSSEGSTPASRPKLTVSWTVP